MPLVKSKMPLVRIEGFMEQSAFVSEQTPAPSLLDCAHPPHTMCPNFILHSEKAKAFLGLCVKLHNKNGLCKNVMNVKRWKLWLFHSIGSKQVAEWSMANFSV